MLHILRFSASFNGLLHKYKIGWWCNAISILTHQKTFILFKSMFNFLKPETKWHCQWKKTVNLSLASFNMSAVYTGKRPFPKIVVSVIEPCLHRYDLSCQIPSAGTPQVSVLALLYSHDTSSSNHSHFWTKLPEWHSREVAGQFASWFSFTN